MARKYPWAPPLRPARDWTAVDARLGLPNNLQIMDLAQRINAVHVNNENFHDSIRDWSRLAGLYGERHVARVLELPMDVVVKPYGNQRRNLVLPDGTPIDVVTRIAPRNGAPPDLVLRTTNRVPKRDTIMMLVVMFEDGIEPWIAGWAWDSEMRLQPIGEFREGVQNWIMPITMLHPVTTLPGARRSA